jgi:hypothetical protein
VTNITSSTDSATFTYTVSPASDINIRVTQVKGTKPGASATSDLSASLIGGSSTIKVNPLPTVYNLVSGAITICSNDSVRIGLSGSQTNATYYLKHGATTVGAPLPGTGSAITFGAVSPVTNTTYTAEAVATGTTTACTNTMAGSTVVTVTNCAPLVISLGTPPTNVILSWGGNRWLQSADSLVLPLWTNLLQGGLPGITNFRTNPVTANLEFFRLTAPTNGP